MKQQLQSSHPHKIHLIFDNTFVLFGLLQIVQQTIAANCLLPISQLTLFSPVPIRNNHFIQPPDDGVIQTTVGQPLQLYCSTEFQNYPATDTVTAVCQPNGQYQTAASSNLLVNGAQLQCTANNVRTDVVQSPAPNADAWQLGYTIGGSFAALIDLRFDASKKRTIYAHHKIWPVDADAQQRVTRDFSNAFRADRAFTAADEERYSYKAQRDTICKRTLRFTTDPPCDALFEQSRRFLARGHLAASADFVYLASKRATYSLLNVAAQWQQLNNGPWKRLEAGVRARSIATRAVLEVYTGTVGTLRLADAAGQQRDVYLDDSAGGRMPVPLVFFKVVTDGATKGVVYLALNNPYASAADVQAATAAVGCQDVAGTLSWPKSVWFEGAVRVDRTTPVYRTLGYVWACAVPDFVKKVPNLPAVLTATAWTLLN